MATTHYVMNRQVLARFRGQISCRACGKPIEVGQEAVGNLNRTGTKIYHKECYNSMYQVV